MKQNTSIDQQVVLEKHSPLRSQPGLSTCQKLRLAILAEWPSHDSKNVPKHNFIIAKSRITPQIKK